MSLTPIPFVSRKRILARLSALKTERAPHEQDWRNITDYIRPGRGRYLYGGEASARPTSMINSTPFVASRTLAAGMLSGASSQAYNWFKFVLDDPDLEKWGPARQHIELREKKVYEVLADSNFYQNLETIYGDSADFGTGGGILDESEKDVINLRVMSPGEYWIDVNEAGDVDTCYREYELTAIQLLSRKDYADRLPRFVRQEYDAGRYQTRFKVLEAIEANQDWQEGREDWMGKEYTRFVFLLRQDVGQDNDRDFLLVSGYNEWPMPNIRWSLASGNKWGWGPGLIALGDSKALQTFEFRYAQGLEKAIAPPMSAPTVLRNKPISHAPGGITYVDAFNNGAALSPLYLMQAGVLQAVASGIQEKEFKINEVYYKDLFLMLATSDRREITAREVEEKHQEKLLSLGPVLGRTHRDALDTAIMRAYQICERRGLFPSPPPELRERLIGIRYTSALAYAQRAAGAASIERFFGFTGNLVQAFPQVSKKINIFAGIDEYAESIGVPAVMMVSNKDAEAAAQAEAQQAQAAQSAAAAPQMAQAAQLLSETDTTRPSALSFIAQRAGLA